MNALLTRCRHIKVNWLDSHSCHCLDCGKTGHWFELERLVMWTRGRSVQAERPLLPATVPSQNHLSSGPAVSSLGG